MKYQVAASFVALALSSVVPACSGSHARQQSPPREPTSTTTVTSSALTAGEAPRGADATLPGPPAAPLRDPDRVAPNAPATGQSEADRVLSTKIRQHLARSPELKDVGWNRVQIVNVDGNVTISGELPTIADAIAIEHAVREVKGVKSVTNEIHTQ